MSETEKLMPVDQRRLVLPLWRRAWICATGFRAWRTRRALDKAICLMIRNDMETETAYQLLEVSNRLWDAAFYGQNAIAVAPPTQDSNEAPR